MTETDLEFQISQYVDSTLDAPAAVALEAKLRDDAGARAMLADYRRVAALVRNNTALPAINWNALGNSISANIDRSEAQRIDQTFRMPFIRIATGAAAVAACVVLGLLMFRDGEIAAPGPVAGVTPALVAPAKVIEIAFPSPQLAAGPRIAEVSIDAPAANVAVASLVWDDLQPRSMRIVVAAGAPVVMPDALLGQ